MTSTTIDPRTVARPPWIAPRPHRATDDVSGGETTEDADHTPVAEDANGLRASVEEAADEPEGERYDEAGEDGRAINLHDQLLLSWQRY